MNKKFKILIVDDEESLRETFSEILSTEGYEVSIAKDGYEAIEKIKNDTYQVAFLDIKMPGINGVETFKEIKKIDPNVVIFMMTAYSQQELIEEALKEGAYGCLSKPIDFQQIEEIVHNIECGRSIMIIDDDKNLADLLSEKLKERGYKTIEATDANSALKILKQNVPDLILVDVFLPDINGVDLVKEINKNLKKEAEIIMMSAYDVEEKIKDVLGKGVKKFFKKPINFLSLEKTIQELLENKKTPPSILVVDDDESFINILRKQLNGYRITAVEKGADAIEEIKLSNYDIVILNFDTVSEEIYEEIKKINPTKKLILISNKIQDSSISTAIKNNEIIFLKKPFNNIKSLLEIVKKIIS